MARLIMNRFGRTRNRLIRFGRSHEKTFFLVNFIEKRNFTAYPHELLKIGSQCFNRDCMWTGNMKRKLFANDFKAWKTQFSLIDPSFIIDTQSTTSSSDGPKSSPLFHLCFVFCIFCSIAPGSKPRKVQQLCSINRSHND